MHNIVEVFDIVWDEYPGLCVTQNCEISFISTSHEILRRSHKVLKDVKTFSKLAFHRKPSAKVPRSQKSPMKPITVPPSIL